MNKFIERIANDDIVWTTLSQNIHGGSRQSRTNFLNFNCPMCITRGESADTKQRCGIIRSPDHVGVSCFNCGFRARWSPGTTLSRGMRALMVGIGVPEREVKKINLKLFQYRRIIESSPEAQAFIPIAFTPNFKSTKLPAGAKSFTKLVQEGCTNPNFLRAIAYAQSRGEDIFNAVEFYWSPAQDRDMNERVIIPFHWQGAIVGWTARYFGDNPRKERYWQHVPADFLYNNRVLNNTDRRYNIVVEGVLDAAAIDGVSPLGAKLSDRQAMWLNGSGKTTIYVADRDSQGGRAIDFALKHKWHVAFPRLRSSGWWEADVKDAAKATERYGRLYTLRSILETATNDKTKIDTYRKMMV